MRHRSPVAPALLVCAALAGCLSNGSKAPDPGDPPDVPYDAPPQVTADLAGGAYRAPVTVALRCVDDRGACASIHYTLDGSVPTESTGLVYRGPISITETAALQFFGRDAAGHDSTVQYVEFVIDPNPPVTLVDPPGGVFSSLPGLVSLLCWDAGFGCAGIRYTTDGTAPSSASNVYSGPLLVWDGMEVRAISFDRAGNASPERRETYRRDQTAPTTSASPSPGTFGAPVDVSLSCDDGAGAGCRAIHYTLDGTYPTTASPAYDGAIRIDRTTELRYFSVDAVGLHEYPQLARYVVDTTPPTTTPSQPAGTYAPTWVSLSCSDADSGCERISWTTDGSEPGPSSPSVTGSYASIPISTTTTLRYASVDRIGNREATQQARYVIDAVQPTVAVSPPGGSYGPFVDVQLSCDDGPAGSGCSVRYTTDGSAPTSSSTVYESPVRLTGSARLRYAAFDGAGNAATGFADYTIDHTAPRLYASMPPDGGVGADPAATKVALVFDEAVDTAALAATVDGAAAPLSASGAQVTVTLPAAFSPDTAHAVSIAGVRDSFGNAQASATTIRFRTRGDVISPSDADGSATVVALGLAYDGAGNALAVYRADTGKGRKLLLARYDAATGAWSAPAELYREAVPSSPAPLAAVASRGDGFLVAWSAAGTVRARLVDAAGVASGDELPPLWNEPATELAVATNGTGYAVVAVLSGAVSSYVYDGKLWSPAEAVGKGGSVALAADGDAYVAAYLAGEPGARSVSVARRGAALGWDGGALYVTDAALGAPSVAARGGRVAVAFPVLSALGAVLASVGPGTALPTPSVVANATQPSNVSVAVSGAGAAVAFQGLVSAGSATYALVHDGTSWSGAERLATASGAPAGTRLASDGAGYLALLATADADGRTSLLGAARAGAAWSAPDAVAPGGASARNPLLVARASGYALAFDQDDGERHALRVRSHTGATVAGALGALVDAARGGPGAAREACLAGDGAGGGLVVWTQEHRGGPAVLAASVAQGAPGTAALVALGGESPAVAAAQDGYVIVYRRGDACEARTWSAGAVSDAVRIDDGVGGACTSPVVASAGQRHIAAWRAGSQLRAAVFDGTRWAAPFAVATNAPSGGAGVAARPGQLAVAWSTGSVLQFRVNTENGWGATSTLASYSTASADAPRLAASDAGFAVVWTRSGIAYASGSTTGAFPTTPASLGAAVSVAVAANGTRFTAFVARSWGDVGTYSFGTSRWDAYPTIVPGTPASPLVAASGPRGLALAFGDGAGGLRGASLVDGWWSAVEPVRAGVQGAPTLAWDGESYLLGWTEPDADDATIDRVRSRRGL